MVREPGLNPVRLQGRGLDTSALRSHGEVPESGLSGLPAKQLATLTWSVGSNPTLSALAR